MKIISIGVVLTVFAGFSGSITGQTADCDRECLHGMTDAYLNAVIKNDPALAPIMPGFRQTENAQVMRLGTGTWKTVTGLAGVGRYYLDPVNGQAAWFGVVQEGDSQGVTITRIKVVERQITEAEWFIGRRGQAGMQGPADPDGSGQNLFDPENILRNPPPAETTVALEDRLSRLSLSGIANSYFDGITSNDGSIIQSSPDCFRVENGFLTAGRPYPENSTDPFKYNGKTNCQYGMGTFNIALVASRRFLVIDEAQQAVVTSAVFLRNADGHQRRCVFFEIFYIEENLIREIYSTIYYPDPNLPVPNWPPYHGTFPLPESFGKAR